MLDDLRVDPFSRDHWHGEFRSLDDTEAGAFTEEDVAEVVAAGDSGGDWDGSAAAVLLLKDGRYVAFETFYGPTGDGFCEDAYGGDADLLFAGNLETVRRFGLTKEGRRLCDLAIPEDRSSSGEQPPPPPPGSAGSGGGTDDEVKG